MPNRPPKPLPCAICRRGGRIASLSNGKTEKTLYRVNCPSPICDSRKNKLPMLDSKAAAVDLWNETQLKVQLGGQ